jgi:hypothetical protein
MDGGWESGWAYPLDARRANREHFGKASRPMVKIPSGDSSGILPTEIFTSTPLPH